MEENQKALQRKIQNWCRDKYKNIAERNTNGCGPSYQPADGGGWIVAATTHKTNRKENDIGKGANKNEKTWSLTIRGEVVEWMTKVAA